MTSRQRQLLKSLFTLKSKFQAISTEVWNVLDTGVSEDGKIRRWKRTTKAMKGQSPKKKVKEASVSYKIRLKMYVKTSIHPSSAADLGSGHGNSSLSREVQTSLCPATLSSSS